LSVKELLLDATPVSSIPRLLPTLKKIQLSISTPCQRYLSLPPLSVVTRLSATTSHYYFMLPSTGTNISNSARAKVCHEVTFSWLIYSVTLSTPDF
jgi:hypothetical protein